MSSGGQAQSGASHSPSVGSGLRILLADTKRWATGPRVGKAFANLGCTVGMVCPPQGHPASTIPSIRRRFAYRGLAPISSLRRAIREFDPHLILPVCDRSRGHLHRLYARAQQQGDRRITELLERSLGPAATFPIVASRYDLMMLAHSEGIPIAETVALRTQDDLRLAARLGFPLVLKSDGTWGGVGVQIAHNPDEALCARRGLSQPQRLTWLLKELALTRDRGTTIDDWRNFHPSLIAQKWIEGHPANCAVACAEGKILAGIAVEVAFTNGDRGPASLVEVVDGAAMLHAAECIARRLRLSGFFGFDFMIEKESRQPFLIEMNPRCTQTAMLTLGRGRNLPAAMAAYLAGRPEPETTPMTGATRIAYFPKPAAMPDPDPASPKWSYYYDLPQDEPAFVRLMLNQWPDRALLGRCLDRARTRAASSPAGASAARKQNDLHPSDSR